MRPGSVLVTATLLGTSACLVGAQQPTSTTPGSDANGNPRRLAVKTGHISNYDEAKVRPYTLPDPLVGSDGQAVRDAHAWMTVRRPEIVHRYETEIFGRIPATAPGVTWQVRESDTHARGGAAVMKRIAG